MDTESTPIEKNRLHWLLDRCIELGIEPSKKLDDGSGKWENGLSIFVKPPSTANRPTQSGGVNVMPGFALPAAHGIVRSRGLVYYDISARRSDEQLRAESEDGTEQRANVGRVLAVALGQNLTRAYRTKELRAVQIERRITEIVDIYKNDPGTGFDLREMGFLKSVEDCLKEAGPESNELWNQLMTTRSDAKLALETGYILSCIPDDTIWTQNIHTLDLAQASVPQNGAKKGNRPLNQGAF